MKKLMNLVLISAAAFASTLSFADQLCGPLAHINGCVAQNDECLIVYDQGGDGIRLSGRVTGLSRYVSSQICVEGRYTSEESFEVASARLNR